MMNIDKKYIAQIIQEARRKSGLKQSELAEKVDLSEKHLSKIERGNNYPSLDTFLKLVDVLGLSLGDFGLTTTDSSYPNRVNLHKIIDNSSDKQIDAYTDVITTMQKYL